MSPPDGAAEIRRIVDVAEDVKPEPPRPLMRELPPADPFPVDALGDVLGDAARAIHDRVQAPMAIGAQSVLAAAALAVQGHADVELPIGGGSARPVSGLLRHRRGHRRTQERMRPASPMAGREARGGAAGEPRPRLACLRQRQGRLG